jgi:hypothetical protein
MRVHLVHAPITAGDRAARQSRKVGRAHSIPWLRLPLKGVQKNAGEIDRAIVNNGQRTIQARRRGADREGDTGFPAPRRPRQWRQFVLDETPGEAVAVDSPYRPDPDDLAGVVVSNLSALASLLLTPCFGSKSALLGVANVCE